ncbi:MAG: hypothetical protein WAK40_03665 [Thermoplasmata archaeon]
MSSLAPVCSNCNASDFVWVNELRTGTMGGGSLSIRSRGELSLGTRLCRNCGHADLFLKDPSVLRMPHTWRPGEFVPIPTKPAPAAPALPPSAPPSPPVAPAPPPPAPVAVPTPASPPPPPSGSIPPSISPTESSAAPGADAPVSESMTSSPEATAKPTGRRRGSKTKGSV